MALTILLFGQTANLTGFRELKRSYERAATIEDVMSSVAQEFPKLENGKFLYALNQEYADPGTRVVDGDEIAIFTPVSGG